MFNAGPRRGGALSILPIKRPIKPRPLCNNEASGSSVEATSGLGVVRCQDDSSVVGRVGGLRFEIGCIAFLRVICSLNSNKVCVASVIQYDWEHVEWFFSFAIWIV